MHEHGHMSDVELVEGAVEDPLQPEPPGADPARRWRRVMHAWPVVVVAVLVAGAYAMQGRRASADLAARQEALHGQSGFVADLGRDLRPVWATDGVTDLYNATVAEATVLVRAGAPEDSTGQVAIDLRTGAHRWYLQERRDARQFCGGLGGGSVGTVECITTRFGQVGRQGYGEVAQLAELRDLATGEVVVSRDVVDHVLATWWDGELLLIDATDSGLELRRETGDGTVRWVVPVLDRMVRDDEPIDVRVERGLALVRVAGRALAVDPGGSIVLDRELPGDAWRLATLHGGGVALTHDGPEGTSLQAFDSSGALELETEGAAYPTAAVDGSVPGVVVVATAGAIEVWDRARATRLLTVEGRAGGDAYVLDGALVLMVDGALRAFDLRSGAQRWAVDQARGLIVGTDGQVVLVLVRDGVDSSLRAISLRSGREAWRVALEAPTSWPRVLGGALVIHSGSALVRWSS